MIARLARWLDSRIGTAEVADRASRKVFPESWTFLFGELALYAFVVLLVTGTILALFFDASMAETTYEGSYVPLQGVEVSAAYASGLDLSFDVKAGLLLRQTHHWAALLFLAAIVVHLLRVFFTGAFRRPRDLNWVVGVSLLVLGIVEGFLGYSLLDDVLSGIGVQIMHATLEGIPVVGVQLAALVFDGPYPGEAIIGRLFVAHVFVVPGIIVGALTVHLLLVLRQVHTQFPGAGRREDNVVGLRLWPGYATRSVGLLLLVGAVLVGLGGLVQINPIWLYGPYDPVFVTTAAQPDWYMGWLEGALRLSPPIELQVGPYLVPQHFLPTIVFPGLLFTGLAAWPWIERRVTGDDAEHHLLDRPRDAPGRVAFGVGMLTFLAVLFLGGSQDIIAVYLDTALPTVTRSLQAGAVVLPPLTAWLALRWARDLSRGPRPPGERVFAELVVADPTAERTGTVDR